jgi:GTP-binding protein
MLVKEARFVVSNSNYKSCPPPIIPEYAFIGRSNVGKSSLINMLSNHKGLAKISVSPGKTQLINHFLINEEWYLVDLPGYGYAKTSKKSREKWKIMIEDYLVNRENLVFTFVLIDLRIPPQNNDREIIDNFGESQLPLGLVFTKYDKLSRTEAEKNLSIYKKELHKNWEELPPIYVTSSKTTLGRDELLDFIERTNKEVLPSLLKKITGSNKV